MSECVVESTVDGASFRSIPMLFEAEEERQR